MDEQAKQKAAKMQFRFGHLGQALANAGEPQATIENIQNGTYTDTDEVVEKHEESNSCGH